MRRSDQCPRDDCSKEPIRVERRVIEINGEERVGHVYWHSDGTYFSDCCIETPDGDVEHVELEPGVPTSQY